MKYGPFTIVIFTCPAVYATVDDVLRSFTVTVIIVLGTLFCSIKITNFYTLDVHSDMIDDVHHFLTENLYSNKLGNVTILTIKNLLHLYLYNNVLSYGEQIY